MKYEHARELIANGGCLGAKLEGVPNRPVPDEVLDVLKLKFKVEV